MAPRSCGSTAVHDGDVETEIVRGGTVRSRAGVSIPSERLTTSALTAKDRADVPRALEPRGGPCRPVVRPARRGYPRRCASCSGPSGPLIVAKIETRAAVDDFDRILDAADAVMIARGDMGVELPYEEVPIIQKQLVRRALDRGVPSIVATQMLESMIASPRPTRAEASDVANAVFDGADAIMLSGETAIGAYPILAAEAAVRICRLCEQRGSEHLAAGAPPSRIRTPAPWPMPRSRWPAAEDDIVGIACYTRTGSTARILSSLRPRVPIFAFSPDPRSSRGWPSSTAWWGGRASPRRRPRIGSG